MHLFDGKELGMAIEEDQIYSAERRGMIYARIHQLSNLSELMRDNYLSGHGDAADIASRLIEACILLRLLLLTNEPEGRGQ